MTRRADLFATQVAVKNFRGYGEFTLDLPATPCAVLLSGANGLGKTTFFEAVEWGLTGAVKRLDSVAGGKVDPRDLARKAAGVDAFEVRLAFCDAADNEERVTRTQLLPQSGAAPSSVGTTVAQVAELLRSDETRWNVGANNIADYLHLTHLHAQVAWLRLVTFKAKDRWVRVSPLAGADRFERVRTNLTNSKAALTKLRDRREEEVARAVERERQWTEKLRRLEDLQALRGATIDAVPPQEVFERLQALAKAHRLSPDIATNEGAVTVRAASEVVRDVRSALEQARREDDTAKAVLDRMRALPKERADLQAVHASGSSRIAKLNSELAELSATLEQQKRATSHASTAAEVARRDRDRISARHILLTKAVQDRDDAERLTAELHEADAEVVRADRALEDARLELLRRRDVLEAHDSRLRSLDELRTRLAETDVALDAVRQITVLTRGVQAEEVRQAALTQTIREIETKTTSISAELKAKSETIANTEKDQEALRTKLATLQAALLTVAEHLRDEDTACPVCRTTFDAGALKSLALESLSAIDPQLGVLERRAAALRTDEASLRTRERALKSERRKADADARTSAESLAQLRSQIAQLREHPLLKGRNELDAPARLTELRTQQSAALRDLEREALQGKPDELLKGADEAAARVDTMQRGLDAVRDRRNTGNMRLEEVRGRTQSRAAEHPELVSSAQELSLQAQAAAVEAARASDALDQTAAAHASARAAEEATSRSMTAVAEKLASETRSQGAAGTALAALDEKWRAAGLPEPIVETVLDSAIEKVMQRRDRRETSLRDIADLSASLERWQKASDLQALGDEIRSEHAPTTREAHGAMLRAEVSQARVSLATAQRGREAADELANALQRVTDAYGERALRPFDALFRRYLRALVHDERFHDIELTYEGSARSAALRFRVGLAGFDTDAEFILSEGQLGEVSLAAMLAASATFPWSRWRALLLDDPTQYNDLIHSTSLIDVLRNLVRLAGYQVFISTHDNEQAAFIRRKLDAVAVPWIDCRYVGHGANGLVVNITSNAAQSPVVRAG